MARGLYIRKRYQLMPGVVFNVSKTGASVSLGPKDAHITTGSHGTFLYVNLPGAGIFYRRKLDAKSNGKSSQQENGDQNGNLDINFWHRLTVPPSEIALVEALKALQEENFDEAYQRVKGADHLADGAFLAGFLALKREDCQAAVDHFNIALEKQDTLNEKFTSYDIDMHVMLPVTDEVGAQIQPNEQGVLLALVEAYQHCGKEELAIEVLKRLHEFDPEDVMIRLSLAELLSHLYPDAPQIQQDIIKLAEDVHNISPLHAGLMYYRARALRKLNLLDGARDTLTKALRRKKDYPPELLRALRYERAVIYEATGKEKEAHKEYEKIFAEAPDYEDVAARLGF